MIGCLTVALFAAALTISPPAAADHRLQPAEAHALAEAGDILLVDVRAEREWRLSGVPAGARTLSMHGTKGLRGLEEALLQVTDGDHDRPIVLLCAQGVRSDRASDWLAARGWRDVHDVAGGLFGHGSEPGWLDEGLPVEPCRTC